MIILYFVIPLFLKCVAIPEGSFSVNCKNSVQDNNFCMDYNKTGMIYTLYPCEDGFTCEGISKLWIIEPNIGNYNKQCISKSKIGPIIGESFDSDIRFCMNSDCHFCENDLTTTNYTDCCNNHKCTTGVNNTKLTCNDNNDCNSGFYCNGTTFQCLDAKKDGAYCENDEECNIGSGCNINICTKLFSLDIGKLSEDSRFCKTNWAITGFCEGLYLEMNDMAKRERDYSCNDTNLCVFKLKTTKEFNSVYSCPLPPQSDAGLCNMDLIYIKDEVGDLFESLQYRHSNCSSIFAHTDNIEVLLKCGSITSTQYYNFINKYYWMLFNNLNFTTNFTGNEECSKINWLTNYSGNWTSYQKSTSLLLIFHFIFILIEAFL